ncbi:hypothetical protein [Phenylobacterium sp.]|jgi:hypothetical protein|uniref:hypothetical protein n=1 Tax=Phenylobacterium sp. TaxID=1871053 RepID=UPI002E2FCD38|nr:hypothetical protein [Phenylobacterium sp.]HEX3363446.1 hypothetical protein [Phenylobacterium sp.]
MRAARDGQESVLYLLDEFAALVQAYMNLRQVVEGVSNAAFALAEPAAEYVDADTNLVTDSQATNLRSYKWVRKEFPLHSSDLKDVKDLLNDQATHFHIVHSERLVRSDVEGGQWGTDFFDKEDRHLSHADLWLVAQTAVAGMHLLEQVRQRFGGYVPAADLDGRANVLAAHAQELVAEMTATERHKAASRAAAKADARRQAAKDARREN